MQSIKDGKTAFDKASVIKKFDELEIPSNSQANNNGSVEENREPPRGHSSRYQPTHKPRNFKDLDHRQDEYKIFRRNQGSYGRGYRKGENPLYNKNRERFMNSHENDKTNKQAGIPRNFIN